MATLPKSVTGIGAKGMTNGRVKIALFKAGKTVAALELPAKDAGSAAATILGAALASYVLTPNKSPAPTSMENLPVLQSTTLAIGGNPKPNHYTLNIVMGEAQIGFELTPGVLRPLGQALIAASAGGAGAKPQ